VSSSGSYATRSRASSSGGRTTNSSVAPGRFRKQQRRRFHQHAARGGRRRHLRQYRQADLVDDLVLHTTRKADGMCRRRWQIVIVVQARKDNVRYAQVYDLNLRRADIGLVVIASDRLQPDRARCRRRRPPFSADLARHASFVGAPNRNRDFGMRCDRSGAFALAIGVELGEQSGPTRSLDDLSRIDVGFSWSSRL
jgi:hypothetical protein